MAGDGRNHFINPITGFDYAWDLNHTTEDTLGKTRQITHSGATSRRTSQATTNTGLVKQQGDDSPMVVKLTGTIMKATQLGFFITFWQLCNSQTIYYEDFSGEKFEVIITELLPVKKGVASNPRDPVYAPLWVWTYTMSMEVVTILAGMWVGVTP